MSYSMSKETQTRHKQSDGLNPDVSASNLCKLFGSTSKLRGAIVSGASNPQGTTMISCAYYTLTTANKWGKLFATGHDILMGASHFPAIRHPYVATGAFLCISANPELLLTPLQLAVYICLLPFKALGRFMMYVLGFRRRGHSKRHIFD